MSTTLLRASLASALALCLPVGSEGAPPRSLSDLPSPSVGVPSAPTPRPQVRALASPVPLRTVKLIADVDVPVVSGGKTIGSMTLKKGMGFKVTAETPQTVTVQNGKMLHVLKREWTDINPPAPAKP